MARIAKFPKASGEQVKCNKCNEEVTACENCGIQFDKSGMSIYCLVVKENSTVVFRDEDAQNKDKKSKKKHTHHHYCSSECVKESGAAAADASSAKSYD